MKRDKQHTWPVYVTSLRARLRGAQIYLLVIAPEADVAAWAVEPIPLGIAGSGFVPACSAQR